jgi:hypothetical protein
MDNIKPSDYNPFALSGDTPLDPDCIPERLPFPWSDGIIPDSIEPECHFSAKEILAINYTKHAEKLITKARDHTFSGAKIAACICILIIGWIYGIYTAIQNHSTIKRIKDSIKDIITPFAGAISQLEEENKSSLTAMANSIEDTKEEKKNTQTSLRISEILKEANEAFNEAKNILGKTPQLT